MTEILALMVIVGMNIISLICVFNKLEALESTLRSTFFNTQAMLLRTSVERVETPDESVEIADEPDTPYDSHELTENEIQRLEREAEFDLRIARIKEELAMRTPDVPRKGTEALQLHPHVHNLPHNIITDFSDDLPDVEYTD